MLTSISSFRLLPIIVLSALLGLLLTIEIAPRVHVTVTTFYDAAMHSPQRENERLVETYDFVPHPNETACYHASLPPVTSGNNNTSESGLSVSLEPIPNVVHFIYGLDPSASELPFLAYVAIRSALDRIRPDVLKLHHTYLNPRSRYLIALGDRVQLVHHDHKSLFHSTDAAANIAQAAHLADLLRLDLLASEGGIYLDSDVIALRSFEQLRHSPRDVVLGHEGGDRRGLCNAIIMARPGSKFIRRWRDSYSTFDRHEWNEHSVILPKKLATLHPTEICSLAPSVWFWPTWTPHHIEYMHELLHPEGVAVAEATIAANNGSFWPDQLAYHTWSQVASKAMGHLNRTAVNSTPTRFNLLIRQFLSTS